MHKLKKDDIVELVIEKSTADEGKFIARLDNYVIFIPRTIIGETVKAKITKVKKNYAEAIPVEIIQASNHRIEAKCKHYNLCSGCQYQHINYDYQLYLKETNLLDVLKKLADIDYPKDNIELIKSPRTFNYRNKIKYTIKKNTIGFLSKFKHQVIPIDKCLLAPKEINELYAFLINKELKEILKYDHLYLKFFKKPIAYLEKTGRIYAAKEDQLLTYTLQKKEFKIPINSFFQTNNYILDSFITQIQKALNPSTDNILIDLFCGVGFFSILFTEHYSHIYGIDIDKQSISSAKEALQENNITNVSLLTASANQGFTDILPKIKNHKVSLIIDPPRTGLDSQTCQLILSTDITKIVYVSCYPATLSRDLKILLEKYNLTDLTLVDMFPQTSHMEIIATLELKVKSEKQEVARVAVSLKL